MLINFAQRKRIRELGRIAKSIGLDYKSIMRALILCKE